MGRPSNPNYVARLFTQLDEFTEFTGQASPWELRFLQLDAGCLDGQISLGRVGGTLIVLGRFGRRLAQEGAPPQGMRTFVIPADETQQFRWRGCAFSAGKLGVFPAGGELVAVSPPGFAVFTVSVPEEVLVAVADAAGIESPDRALDGVHLAKVPWSVVEGLRRQVARIFETLAGAPGTMGDPAVATRVEQDLAGALLQAVRCGDETPGLTEPRLRKRALERSREYLETCGAKVITVGDLCRAAETSERTLRRAFREHYGVSPKAYLTALRLNGVREGLWNADVGPDCVADVANRLGFWHMGQFAADYRKLFGELPSQTLGARIRYPV